MGNNKESSKKTDDRGEFLTKNAAIVRDWPSWMKDSARKHNEVDVKTDTRKVDLKRSDRDRD